MDCIALCPTNIPLPLLPTAWALSSNRQVFLSPELATLVQMNMGPLFGCKSSKEMFQIKINEINMGKYEAQDLEFLVTWQKQTTQ